MNIVFFPIKSSINELINKLLPNRLKKKGGEFDREVMLSDTPTRRRLVTGEATDLSLVPPPLVEPVTKVNKAGVNVTTAGSSAGSQSQSIVGLTGGR